MALCEAPYRPTKHEHKRSMSWEVSEPRPITLITRKDEASDLAQKCDWMYLASTLAREHVESRQALNAGDPELRKRIREAYRTKLLRVRSTQGQLIITVSLEDKIHEEFEQLKNKLKEDTKHFSFEHDREAHDAYQRIIAMGVPVIPFMLRDMLENRTLWFGALGKLTNADPTPPERRGRVSEMIKSWLEWGKAAGYYPW